MSRWNLRPARAFACACGVLALLPAVLGIICVTLNTVADALAVIGAYHLLDSSVARAAKARWMTRTSGVTMLGLGAYLASAQRN